MSKQMQEEALAFTTQYVDKKKTKTKQKKEKKKKKKKKKKRKRRGGV
jgi:hypothetical protein